MSSTIASRWTSTMLCLRAQNSSLPSLCRTLQLAKPPHLKQNTKSPSSIFRTYASKPQPTRLRKPSKTTKPAPPPLPRTAPKPTTTTKSTTKPTTTNLPTPATQGYLNTQDLLTHTLSTKTSPTLLYLAPSSNTFAITCLGVGASALSYGLYNFYDAYLVPHPGLWWLVPYMMAGVSIFMVGTGVWIGLGARRLVGSLSAVPTKIARSPGLMGKTAAGEAEAGLLVRLESKPILPFLPVHTLDVPLSDIQLGTRVVPVAAGLTTFNSSLQAPGQYAIPARQMRREAQLREARQTEDKTLWGVLTGPFRTFLRGGMSGIGRVVARDGFVGVYVAGKMWRMDVREGWVLDEGATLDRLLKLR